MNPRMLAIAGKKYPEKTPINIARNIQRVRYLSKKFKSWFHISNEILKIIMVFQHKL